MVGAVVKLMDSKILLKHVLGFIKVKQSPVILVFSLEDCASSPSSDFTQVPF